jgi:hypothetical protein
MPPGGDASEHDAETTSGSAATDTYTLLLAWLNAHGISYRPIDHAPDGRAEVVNHLVA